MNRYEISGAEARDDVGTISILHIYIEHANESQGLLYIQADKRDIFGSKDFQYVNDLVLFFLSLVYSTYSMTSNLGHA